MRILFLTSIISIISRFCLCFHDVPHMLIIGIALRELKRSNSKTYEVFERNLNTMIKSGLNSVPENRLEESAVWADEIKVYEDIFSSWNMWHYIGNQVYNP